MTKKRVVQHGLATKKPRGSGEAARNRVAQNGSAHDRQLMQRKNEFQNCEKTERSGNRCLLGANRDPTSVLILSVRRLSGLSRSLDPAAVRQASHCHSLSHYSCKHMHVQNEKTCSKVGHTSLTCDTPICDPLAHVHGKRVKVTSPGKKLGGTGLGGRLNPTRANYSHHRGIPKIGGYQYVGNS